ncbi:MAG: acetyl-CoA decarbonylase/synthase complex subunit delta [Pseudomonadota bacterium]
MGVEIPKQSYTGKIREIQIGKGETGFKVGGASSYPFYLFEGEMPNPPKVGFEVADTAPTEWAGALNDIYKDVYADPGAWARKCVDEFKADFIHVELAGTDPNASNLDAAHAVEVVKKVAGAVNVPIAVWGSTNVEKDAEVLRAVAESIQDRQLMIGPVQEGNYKQLGAAVIGYNHIAIASSPIDINLAKQLNVLLGNLGVSDNNILIDPTVGGVGYGLEYTYSVIERARMAALVQQDERLQFPMYCNMGKEVWKTKEAKQTAEEAPELGKAKERGIMLEIATASAVLMAGGDMLVVRHPESAKHVRSLIGELGG